MKTLEDLGDYYNGVLLPDLRELEKERRTTRTLVSLLGAAVAAAAVGLVVFFRRIPSHAPRDAGDKLFYGAALLAALASGAYFVYRALVAEYALDFKAKILKKLLAFIDPGLSYSALGRVDQGVFVGSGLFAHWPDDYDGEDYVCGTLGETPLQFSLVDARYETVDQKGNRVRHRLFDGLFIAADFNKKLHGMTFVLPDVAKGLLGDVLGTAVQSYERRFGQLVTLEDPEFNRLFVVYSTDQVEARYVLTPALMSRLVKYARLSGETPYFSFVGNRVHAAIPSWTDPFSPRLFGPVVEFGAVVAYYERVKSVVRIVDDLHLNTRVWTKA